MKELTKAEEMVMQALWEVKKGFAKEIIEEVKWEGKKPAYNTILTILRILVEKGFVKYETFGKSFQYYPVYSKEDYSKFSLERIKDNYFGGSSKSLLSFFAKEEKINIKDLEEMLNQLKKK